jgi:hypothetical protein
MTKRYHLRSAGLLLILGALAIAPSFATTVTYSTTGAFSGGSNVFTGADGLTITYNDLTDASVTEPFPTNAQFGSFDVTGPASTTQTVSTHFSLTIAQSSPTPGTETLTDTFSGTIKKTSSSIVLNFTGGSGDGGAPVLVVGGDPVDGATAYMFDLGGVTYWVDRRTPINPSTTGGGVSTINGAISAPGVPEPSLLGLSSLGFLGLVGMAIRRRKQEKQV